MRHLHAPPPLFCQVMVMHVLSITAQLVELTQGDLVFNSHSYITPPSPMEQTHNHWAMPPYEPWLSEWTSHLTGVSETVFVPLEASKISTPLHTQNWQALLEEYPSKPLASFFMFRISHGFRIGFNQPFSTLKSAKKNLDCALQHPQVVGEYLLEEVTQQRVAGPFHASAVPKIHISRFGVIPKNHKPNKWRLIVDLSHPTGHSVNDGISTHLCTLTYITVDTAIEHILTLGAGTQLAKIDIKNAFRLLPVHPADRHMLGMKWRNQVYIDACLPFGLRSAPKLFNVLADLLSWILQNKGVSPLLHYLDDFLTLGPPVATRCAENLTTIKEICTQLCVPLALDKVEGPCTSLTFLGIVLDTEHMEARLPEEKLVRIRHQLEEWQGKKKATKRQILSLVGLLQHATKVVRPGRTFVSRMYNAAAKLKELSHYTRLNKDFRSDLRWWHIFISHWNGLSFFRHSSHNATADKSIHTDASGSWGCGGCLDTYWFQHAWSEEWTTINIMAKELVPIVLSCAVWGPLLTKKTTVFQCDNRSVVDAINKGSSKDAMVMHLLRCLWFFTAIFDIQIIVKHIPGVTNTSADMLSRNQMMQFLAAHPQASRIPTPLPSSLLHIASPSKLDWTSPLFLQLLRETLMQIRS